LPKTAIIKVLSYGLSIAASVFCALTAGMYVYVDRDVSRQDLGTCENPEEAMKDAKGVGNIVGSC
jgi:hypothetical protein